MPSPNPTARREYRGAAAATTLTTGISGTDTSFVLTAANNWPTGAVGNFIVTIDRGNASEERILCASQASKVVTVAGSGRGFDGTSAISHSAGATVECTLSAFDADEWNQHTNATSGVHGVAGNVVGDTDTQTLTNKTLTTPTIAAVKTNGGAATVTLPASTDTLVGRATTDTLTNKTIDTAGPNTIKVGGVDVSTAWTAYTPTLTNLTLGNGTMNAAYKLIGKTCSVRFQFLPGTTSSASGTVAISLPTAAVSGPNQWLVARSYNNTNHFAGIALLGSGATTVNVYLPTSTTNCGLTAWAGPIGGVALASGMAVEFDGTYEAA